MGCYLSARVCCTRALWFQRGQWSWCALGPSGRLWRRNGTHCLQTASWRLAGHYNLSRSGILACQAADIDLVRDQQGPQVGPKSLNLRKVLGCLARPLGGVVKK